MKAEATITKFDDTWIKAAVIGSIWASFEIVFGSIFHNFRLPFAGTFLTFFGIVLLSTYSFKWDGKNLFLKAGLICALMRSISPTAIIIGPLVGILLEAVFFQLFYNIFGRKIITFVLAGILAMFAAVIHKIVSILIIYGFDILKVLENLYFYLVKVTHINLSLVQLLEIVVAAYTFSGIAAGITGYKLGKMAWTEKPLDYNSGKNYKPLFEVSDFRYSPVYIALVTIAIVVGMVLMNYSGIIYATAFTVLFLILLNIRYGKALKRLKKPVFWFQLLIILLLTSLFWNGFNKETIFDAEGLETGIKIFFRALLLIAGFSAISVELKNPVIKIILFNKGFSGLYLTSEMAVSALPFLIEQNISKKIFVNPIRYFLNTVRFSDSLFNEFKRKIAERKPVFIITGETRSGKTTFLTNIINSLQENNVKVGGIISQGYDKNGERSHFEIKNIITGEKTLLCDRIPSKEKINTGRFFFYPKGIEFGTKAINDAVSQSDLIVIDEIGPLELKGKGWYEVIDKALKANKPMIWVVRKKIIDKVLNAWPGNNFHIFDIEKTDLQAAERMITNYL